MADAFAVQGDTLLRTKGFKVVIDGGADSQQADTFWFRCSGGADVVEPVESTVGNDKYNSLTPGHSHVTPFILEGGMTETRKALISWVDAQMKGEPFRRKITITPLKVDGSEGNAHVYHDCFVEEYTFPELNVERHETITERVVIRALRHEVEGK